MAKARHRPFYTDWALPNIPVNKHSWYGTQYYNRTSAITPEIICDIFGDIDSSINWAISDGIAILGLMDTELLSDMEASGSRVF